VIDNEAGMEHISRWLTKDIDYFFMISDPSRRGLLTIKRIKELAETLKLNIKNFIIIVNRVRGEIPQSTKDFLDNEGITPNIYIEEDDKIAELDMAGKPTYKLPNDSISLQKMNSLLKNFLKGK
jgi:CO dehydrogenase maturation factor